MFSSFERLSSKVLERFQCPHCRGSHAGGNNWRRADRDGSIHSDESEERYRDDPDIDRVDERVDSVSVSSSRATARQNVAPLFKAPPEDDHDAAVLV